MTNHMTATELKIFFWRVHSIKLASLCPSICLSCSMFQGGSHWTDFHEIWYWGDFYEKLYEERVVNAFETWCWERMLKVKRTDRIKNDEVIQR